MTSKMDLATFVNTYWWAVVLVIVILLIWIFFKQDKDTRRKILKIFRGPFLSILFLLIVWFIIAKFGPTIVVKLAHMMMPILILIGAVIWIGILSLKYWSNQFMTPNFHGSYSAMWPIERNGFLIYGIDSFTAGGLSFDKPKRIAVVRRETTEMFFKGSLSLASMGRVSVMGLPDEVQEEIANNSYLKDVQEIYYGWFDDMNHVDWSYQQLMKLVDEKSNTKVLFNMLKKELKINNPKVSTLYFSFINQSKTLNNLKNYFNMNIEHTDTGVEHWKRIGEAFHPNTTVVNQNQNKNPEGEY